MSSGDTLTLFDKILVISFILLLMLWHLSPLTCGVSNRLGVLLLYEYRMLAIWVIIDVGIMAYIFVDGPVKDIIILESLSNE